MGLWIVDAVGYLKWVAGLHTWSCATRVASVLHRPLDCQQHVPAEDATVLRVPRDAHALEV